MSMRNDRPRPKNTRCGESTTIFWYKCVTKQSESDKFIGNPKEESAGITNSAADSAGEYSDVEPMN